MELRDLAALVHIAEVGTISRAAQKLNLTQPALSALIRRLEDELGTKILNRHSRGVALTEEGRFLLERATQILADVSAVKSSLRELAEEPVGEVRVGFPTSMASGVIPIMLDRLNVRFPRIRLRITEQMSGSLMEILHLGHLDMAILFDIQPMPGLRSEPLLIEEIELLVARDDPLGDQPSISLQDLAKRQIVLPSASHSIRQFVDRACMAEGVRLDICADVDSFFGLVGLVESGYPTLLPTFLVRDAIRSGQIRNIKIERPRMTWTLHLATRIDSIRPRAAMVVGTLISEVCSELVRNGTWPGTLHPRHFPQ